MTKYELYRGGVVTNSSSNHNVCGSKEVVDLFYKVNITIESLIPDKRGFFVEHDVIHNLMLGVLSKGNSCEVMTIHASNVIETFLDKLSRKSSKNDNNTPYFKAESIEVTIGMVGGDSHFTTIKRPNNISSWRKQKQT